MANKTVTVKLEKLKPHPKNYREHEDEQLKHIEESIRANGIYRNVVASSDGFILAGHGVVKACGRMGIEEIQVTIVPHKHDTPKAMKLLTGDNEIANLGVIDDRALTEILKGVHEHDDLLGTGFDEIQLATLVLATRTVDEIEDFDAAAEWVGMPEYENEKTLKLILHFEKDGDRKKALGVLGLAGLLEKTSQVMTSWFPPKEKDDRSSVRYE